MTRLAQRLTLFATAALGVLLPAGATRASSDVTCLPAWRLTSTALECANRMFISPGNDTRVNLLLLLRERLPPGDEPSDYPTPDYPNQDFGRTFFDWGRLQAGYWPDGGPGSRGNGSACDSLAQADDDFAGALDADAAVPPAERTALVAARKRLAAVCAAADGPHPDWPAGITSAAGQSFLAYLRAADAFYSGQWGTARQGFAALTAARPAAVPGSPWLAETARYMVARTDLNAAMAGAFDQWGGFAADKVDRPTVLRARSGLQDYLAAYPAGAYTASARGLLRRTIWLEGDTQALAAVYESLLGTAAPDRPEAALLVQEVDAKLPFSSGAAVSLQGPLLLATWDLMRMRQFTLDGDTNPEPVASVLTLLELDAQAPRFAARPDLYQYLRAMHAFQVRKDYRQVVQLVPDETRARAFTPLGFSRQVLRGLALARLGDPAEEGFWRALLTGATGLWQRPTVELALAMSYERHGHLAQVFAAGSPITDRTTREVLLMHAAGPALLGAAAQAKDRSRHERDLALFTLLYKQLSRGDYAGFLASRALVGGNADMAGGLWDFISAEAIPVGLFTAGTTTSAGYACPALATTAAVLARSPGDAKALLCLGEFWRLNGFDGFTLLDQAPRADELGGARSLFKGSPLARGTIYARIIADRTVAADDRAYALYRAVNCYAPSAYNGCGGVDVPVGQRRAWYNQLKRDHPSSRWARALQYYW